MPYRNAAPLKYRYEEMSSASTQVAMVHGDVPVGYIFTSI